MEHSKVIILTLCVFTITVVHCKVQHRKNEHTGNSVEASSQLEQSVPNHTGIEKTTRPEKHQIPLKANSQHEAKQLLDGKGKSKKSRHVRQHPKKNIKISADESGLKFKAKQKGNVREGSEIDESDNDKGKSSVELGAESSAVGQHDNDSDIPDIETNDYKRDSETHDDKRDTERHDDSDKNSAESEVKQSLSEDTLDEKSSVEENEDSAGRNCWVTLNAKKLFKTMDNLEDSYSDTRKQYEETMDIPRFDKEMLNVMVGNRGAVQHTFIHGLPSDPNKIPAGLNLGGYCMMVLPNSILFFHRMKLRNDTRFQVNYLHNDLNNMVITARLSLNDLHLIGAYERAVTDPRSPSNLFYRPTYGEVEFLLKNVQYSMEGRYRLMQGRLLVEHVISHMSEQDIIMRYLRGASSSDEKLSSDSIVEFLERLKTDLDQWLKDYFNDYLTYIELDGRGASKEMQKYDHEKAIALNKYADSAIAQLKKRLCMLNISSVVVPKFTIYSVNGLQLKLKDGVLRGLDSMYRRSVATIKKEQKLRRVDMIIAFSKLKMVYRYEAILNTGIPALSGAFILSADELTAHLRIDLIKEPDTFNLNFFSLKQLKAESLTVEGAANKLIANFKHLLETHVFSIMSNTLIHHVRLLNTITKCAPPIHGYVEPGEVNVCDDGEVEHKKQANYELERLDSIELEYPADEPGAPPKKMKLKYNESLAVYEIEKKK